MLKIQKLQVGALETNCYLAWDSLSAKGVVIDPGDEAERIIKAVGREQFEVCWILNTHGHGDHIGANRKLKETFDAPLLIHEADAPMLTDPVRNISAVFGTPITSPPAEGFLVPGERVIFGDVSLQILHIPGHTPGGVALYGDGSVFTGDTLFCGSVGRCDLPCGDEGRLLGSIREKLLGLPAKTVVLPGHGPETTIKKEKTWNPFLA